MSDARERLGSAQEALVAALLVGGPVPPGFSVERVRATARVLLHKRAARVAGLWPLLAHTLGDDFPPAVERLLATVPPGGALRDGWRVASALRGSGDLPEDALAELLAVEATYRFGDTGARRRHGVSVRFGRCGRRTVVVLRVGGRVHRFG